MEKIKSNQIGMMQEYPLLGVPRQLFEGDNTFVVYERAEPGKTYTFVCPRCHHAFLSSTNDSSAKKVKCPECETYICFSTSGSEPASAVRLTHVSPTDSTLRRSPSVVLVWNDGNLLQKFALKPGTITIGRSDDKDPSDISINDMTASRQSVKIDITRGEQSGGYIYKLTVLRTTNAVYVNHNAMYANDRVYLNLGDIIKVGQTSFTIVPKEG